MKKRMQGVLIGVIITAMLIGGYAIASAEGEQINVSINGTRIQLDQAPIFESDRILVPMRAIFEALGANVLWDEKSQTITATKESTTIIMQIGSKQMVVILGSSIDTSTTDKTSATNNTTSKEEEKMINLDVPPQIINDHTLVPIRAISEALGSNVNWDENANTVYITSGDGNISAISQVLTDDEITILAKFIKQ